MTTVIDHAIAIPTRPATVWEILKDVSNHPQWHPDSKRVQFLTTMTSGRGTRWRNTTKSDKEQVLEITAWYEGLGYEYRIVDGTSYAKNRGRIRLQEAPEGTVLQWTFSYETSGFLGSLRNSISMKGQADREVVQGLRNIYALVKDAKTDDLSAPEDSKAYLKEAPNVQERASYQPRYPSKVASQEIPVVNDDSLFKPPTESSSPLPPQAAASSSIEEPPLTDEDTRPNPSVQKSDPTAAPDIIAEPDFLKAMPDPQPETVLPPLESDQSDGEETSVATPPSVESAGETETEAAPAAHTESETITSTAQSPTLDPLVESLTEGRQVSKLDTSTVSVFEVFGLEKPSETEQVSTLPDEFPDNETAPAPKIEEPPRRFMDSTPIIPDVKPEAPSRRRGLRAAMRSRFPRVRVPKSE